MAFVNGTTKPKDNESDMQFKIVVNHEQNMDLNHRKTSGHRQNEQFSDRFDRRIVAALLLWYFWSALTLFLNKYIIDLRDGDSALLSKSPKIVSKLFQFQKTLFQVVFK